MSWLWRGRGEGDGTASPQPRSSEKKTKPTKAHLGETSKFYYNEKLKKWCVEGEDDGDESTDSDSLPPPPRTFSAGDFASAGSSSDLQQRNAAEGGYGGNGVAPVNGVGAAPGGAGNLFVVPPVTQHNRSSSEGGSPRRNASLRSRYFDPGYMSSSNQHNGSGNGNAGEASAASSFLPQNPSQANGSKPITLFVPMRKMSHRKSSTDPDIAATAAAAAMEEESPATDAGSNGYEADVPTPPSDARTDAATAAAEAVNHHYPVHGQAAIQEQFSGPSFDDLGAAAEGATPLDSKEPTYDGAYNGAYNGGYDGYGGEYTQEDYAQEGAYQGSLGNGHAYYHEPSSHAAREAEGDANDIATGAGFAPSSDAPPPGTSYEAASYEADAGAGPFDDTTGAVSSAFADGPSALVAAPAVAPESDLGYHTFVPPESEVQAQDPPSAAAGVEHPVWTPETVGAGTDTSAAGGAGAEGQIGLLTPIASPGVDPEVSGSGEGSGHAPGYAHENVTPAPAPALPPSASAARAPAGAATPYSAVKQSLQQKIEELEINDLEKHKLVLENYRLQTSLREQQDAVVQMQSDMNDLLVCLGQESAKVQALVPFAQACGEDVDALLARVENECAEGKGGLEL